MKKFFLCFLSVFLTLSAFAEEADCSAENEEVDCMEDAVPTDKLVLSVRRIGLEYSKTQVQNSAEYQDSPIQALKATSQDFIKGIFDTALEYSKDRFKWDNSLFMEYGQTTLKPYNAPETVDENADKILLSSDLSYSCWDFSGLRFGPTVRTAYETEFVATGETPRQNIIRSSAGISLFDHKIIQSLYLTAVHEYDFTFLDSHNSKFGAEFGGRLEYLVRDGVLFSFNGYYREYFSYSMYVPSDLERDLSAILRLDTNLWGNFTMGPYVQYRLAKSRGADVYGSNLIFGVSFNYITKFLLD